MEVFDVTLLRVYFIFVVDRKELFEELVLSVVLYGPLLPLIPDRLTAPLKVRVHLRFNQSVRSVSKETSSLTNQLVSGIPTFTH
jgi:hypothetical protein